jgi:hypothetical protein
MSSSGSIRATLTWIGEGSAPSKVNIVVRSSVEAFTVSNGSSASLNNGFDDGLVITPGIWQVWRKSGDHLCTVAIDASTGEGHFDLAKSVTANDSGLGGAAFADAHGLHAQIDTREITVQVAGNSTFYQAKPGSAKSFVYSNSEHGVTLSTTYTYIEGLREQVPIAYGSNYTNSQSILIGLVKRNTFSQVEQPPAEKYQDFSLFGLSYFPYIDQYGRHGDFSWAVSYRPNYAWTDAGPQSGELSATMTADQPYGFHAHLPENYNVWKYPFGPNEFHHEVRNLVHESTNITYRVVWADGVVGTANRFVTYVHRAEKVSESEEQILYSTALPIAEMPVVPNEKSEGGWIKEGLTNGDFIANPSMEWLNVAGYPSNADIDSWVITCGLTLLKVHPAITAIASAIPFFANDAAEDEVMSGLSRSGEETVYVNPEDEPLFQFNPNLFKWKLGGRPALHVKFHTVDNYDETGFVSTTISTQAVWEPAYTARRILIVGARR